MKTQLQSPKVLAGTATVLFILALTATGIFYSKNQTLAGLLENEKVLTEKLVSEKQQLQNEILGFKNDLSTMTNKNKSLDEMLSEANKKVANKEATITKMGKETSNLKKQIKDVQVMRDELKSEMANLKAAYQQLEDENSQLTQANTKLMNELKDLKEKLRASAVKANNFKVEVMRKKKDKLTVSAKKTHVITVSFEHNLSALAYIGEQKVYLAVTAPDGKLMTADDAGKVKLNLEDMDKELQFSTEKTVNAGSAGSTLTFRFEPNEEMTAGIYKLNVYSDNAYLGSNQFRLVK